MSFTITSILLLAGINDNLIIYMEINVFRGRIEATLKSSHVPSLSTPLAH